MAIQLLPTQLANQIAAGEVVERPASVVKELVENSLDAGARDIHIEIEKGGSRRILIRDNGQGIPEQELTLALSRHATSKIASLDDLEAIMSLGFRGEALASISSVSRLRLVSRTAEQDSAFSAFCEGRDMAVTVIPSAHPVGTTVDVEDLFFNTPARRKFLRTEKTEFGHIEELVRRIALASPQVSFKLLHNGQVVRHYPALAAQAQPISRVGRIVGKRFADEAIYLEHSYGDLQLTGWLSPPDACRHQNDVQYFYVNQRMMRDRLLNHAVRQAYGEMLGADRQPSFVLYLSLPARDVDVNVHPAKHEVRFHQSRQIHDFVLTSLRDALTQGSGGVQIQEVQQHQYTVPDPSRYLVNQPALQNPLPQNAGKTSSRHLATPSALPPAWAVFGQELAPEVKRATEANPPQAADWQPLYRLDAHWLLLAKGEQLAVMRLNELQTAFVQQQLTQAVQLGLSGQPLLLPTQISLPQAVTCLTDYQPHLSRLGVVLRAVGKEHYAILQVPAVLRRTIVAETIPALVALLKNEEPSVPIEARSDVLQWLAQQQSEPLTAAQVQEFWQQLAQEQRPVLQELDWQRDLP